MEQKSKESPDGRTPQGMEEELHLLRTAQERTARGVQTLAALAAAFLTGLMLSLSHAPELLAEQFTGMAAALGLSAGELLAVLLTPLAAFALIAAAIHFLPRVSVWLSGQAEEADED